MSRVLGWTWVVICVIPLKQREIGVVSQLLPGEKFPPDRT
jgi:hypothetical protein